MRKYRICQVDAFTTELFSGNPAGVVPEAEGLSEAEMQRIARELNNSETAFILPPDGADCDVHIRYFTPATEVPLCGHATIAAIYTLARLRELPDGSILRCKTGAGTLPMQVLRDENGLRVLMTGGAIEVYPLPDPAFCRKLCAALGIAEKQLRADMPLAVSSMGHPKVMVPIRDTAALHALRPDMAALRALSGEIGVGGYYVFTHDAQADPQFHGRMFAPAIGIDEDPVTGNANGPVGAYMVHFGLADTAQGEYRYRGVQGEATGRPGIVEGIVRIEDGRPAKVQITGEAVQVFEAWIEL